MEGIQQKTDVIYVLKISLWFLCGEEILTEGKTGSMETKLEAIAIVSHILRVLMITFADELDIGSKEKKK